MTKPCYQIGCAAGSQVLADASPPSGYVWAVNLNNGNVNIVNPDNSGFVRGGRLAPASECQDAMGGVTFDQLLVARDAARKGKRPSVNMQEFESRWLPNLLDLLARINMGTWRPKPTTCFIATKPKAREIHAPDFEDRIVHHLVVPYLESVFEPRFIHDSFSNRKGKGTLAAVARLERFVRQQHSGRGGGYYLQLDIRNYFYSINRRMLWAEIKPALVNAGVPVAIQRLIHAMLSRSPVEYGVNYMATAAERALIPPEKRLDLAPADCGIPIGNYSSQCMANIYLNPLDQFIKHELRARMYVRYVDDFVLIHDCPEQLQAWKGQIESFIANRLGLRLKAEHKTGPITDGIDFLGYVIYPTHRVVRRRVIRSAREKLWQWQSRHVRGDEIVCTPQQYHDIASVWASYLGHFRHASCQRLVADLRRRFPFLAALDARRTFDHALYGCRVTIPILPQRDQLPVAVARVPQKPALIHHTRRAA